MRLALASLLMLAAPLSAQSMPTPAIENPRIQTARWQEGTPVVLTALPSTALTVILEPGETIRRASIGGSNTWSVRVSSEADTFQVSPSRNAQPATLRVETDLRVYDFNLETGTGLMAAYLVRFDFDGGYVPPAAQTVEDTAIATLDPSNLRWTYRIKGDSEVRPLSVRDNGVKTVIEYAEGQSLPAVFAIGPTGDEEVVDGYMRGDVFVIDRVHQELVFRIDKEKATAERNSGERGS